MYVTILLSALCILLFSYSVFVTVLIFKASRRIERHELFFRDTVVDIDHSRNIFDQLVNRREYLADNPDIQQIQRVFAVTLDILTGYLSDGRKFFGKEEGTKKKEEEKK